MKLSRRLGLGVFACLLLTLWIVPVPASETGLTVNMRRTDRAPQKGKDTWAVVLDFNKPVFASNLEQAMTVEADGERIPFTLVDGRTGREVDGSSEHFLIMPGNVEPVNRTIRVAVAESLSDATGRYLLGKERSYTFDAWRMVHLRDFSTVYKSPKVKGLSLHFDRNVSVEDVKKAVEISPEVSNLKVEKSGWRRFLVTGDFDFRRPYELRMKSVPLENESMRFEHIVRDFKGPGIEPEVSIRTKHSVVELRSKQLLPLKVDNVTKIRCRLDYVPPFLVPWVAKFHDKFEFMPDEKLMKKAGSQAMDRLKSSGDLDPAFARSFDSAAEVFFASEAAQRRTGYSLPLSFRADPQVGGAWLVTLSDADDDMKGTKRSVIQVTDLAVSYKRSAKTLLVWVTSVYSGEPVAGAKIMLTGKNGIAYFPGETDKDGILVVKSGREIPSMGGIKTDEAAKRPIDPAEVSWIGAVTDSDSCSIDLSGNKITPSGIKQTAKVRAELTQARGYAFTERGVYQPGEKVHFKFLMREYVNHSILSPEGTKASVTITGPRSEVHYSEKLTLNEFGSCHGTFDTKPFNPVGTYTLTVGVTNRNEKTESFTHTFMIQEYRRPRHYVSMSVKREERETDEYITLDRTERFLKAVIQGRYYAGGPVKHARVRWKATLVPAKHSPKGVEGFFFGNMDKESERFLESGEAMLDRKGRLELTVPVDERLMSGLYGIKLAATVTDVDGEPATAVETFSPRPDYLVGASTRAGWLQPGQSADIKVIVLDRDGNRVQSGTLTASVMQERSFYTRKRDMEGNISSLWEYGWMKTRSSQVPIKDGIARYKAELYDRGRFLVEFSYEKGSQTYGTRTALDVGWDGYDRWYGRRHERSDEAPTARELFLSLNKEKYAVGDTVKIDFHAERPLKKCLMTLERDDVLDYRIIDVNGLDGSAEFTTDETHRPNVFVSVIGAAGRSDFPTYITDTDADIPTIYSGYANIKVRNTARSLNIEIAPDKPELRARPGEEAELSFKIADSKGSPVRAELAVVVVDEAVLALTRFRTPELSVLDTFDLPLAVFFGDLRLSLISQDLFKMLSTKPLTGGGGLGGLIGADVRKDFNPVAYFNPEVVTDEDGTARVEFRLPDSTTKYRVYVVGCDKGSGFGSTQRLMTVNKEFFVEPGIPRFLIPGDRAKIAVVLNNRTKSQGKVNLNVKSSDNLESQLVDPTVRVDPMESELTHVDLSAGGGAEDAEVLLHGTMKTEKATYSDAIRKTIPIESRYLPAHRVKQGSFTKEALIAAELPRALNSLDKKDLVSGDFSARLTVSPTYWNRIAPGLKYLLRYPFGCVEQTSSGIIPLVGLTELIDERRFPGIDKKKVAEFTDGGIQRLLSMQLDNGAFSYWPGAQEASWWGTLYASFALTLARDAGYEVPDERMTAAMDYLRKGLYPNRSQDRYHGGEWTAELALYVLARNGRISLSDLEQWLDKYNGLGTQSQAFVLLAGTQVKGANLQDLRRRVTKLNPVIEPRHRYYYNSSYRTMAVCLLAALSLDAPHTYADDWAGTLLKGIQPEGRWYSTADTGWALLALGRYFKDRKDVKDTEIACTITYGDGKRAEITVKDKVEDVILDPYELVSNGRIRIRSDSKKLLNYTLNLTYPDIISDPKKDTGEFGLVKFIENLNGKEEIRVGDVVRVTLRMEFSHGRDNQLEYAALEDPVPAGMVPINSELKTEGVTGDEEKPDDRSSYEVRDFHPTHFEFRDTGVRVFKDRVWGTSYRYSYLARATTEGRFRMRGSRVSLMYQPERFGRTQGRMITILPAPK